jgi:hypothetical protein
MITGHLIFVKFTTQPISFHKLGIFLSEEQTMPHKFSAGTTMESARTEKREGGG